MVILEPEKWSTLDTFLTRQEDHMQKELSEIRHYLSQQVWSTKILDYRAKFLSPFSVDTEKYFSDSSWYALQIVVENPTDCYAILHDIGHR